MKQIFWGFLVVLSFAGMANAGTRLLDGTNSIPYTESKQTTDAVTMYVRVDGNDTNTCLVDTAAGACLTVQGAVNKVPKNLNSAVTVNVGAGTFSGFSIVGFTALDSGSLTVQGVVGDVSPTVTGTATSGDTYTCVDSGKSWTAHAYQGKMVLVGGAYRFIEDNDATTLYLAGALGGSCSGQAYAVKEHKTIVNSLGLMSIGAIEIGNTHQKGSSSFTISDIAVSSSPLIGVWVGYSGGAKLQRLSIVSSSYYGLLTQNIFGQNIFYDIYVAHSASDGIHFLVGKAERMALTRFDRIYTYHNDGGSGIEFNNTGVYELTDLFSEENSGSGISLHYVQLVKLHGRIRLLNNTVDGIYFYGHSVNVETTDLLIQGNDGNGFTSKGVMSDCIFYGGTISSNTGYGMAFDNGSDKGTASSNFQVQSGGTLTVSSNTAGGILLNRNNMASLWHVVGTGNGSFGIDARHNSFAEITSTTTVTGTSGDATVNGGTTVLTYATDFASDGDIVVNLATGAKIIRRD